MLCLLGSVGSNVSGAGDADRFACERIVLLGKHVGEEVNRAVAGCLGASEGAAEGEAFTGQDAGPLIAKALVLAKHVADLSCAGANVTSWHVGVWTNVAGKLSHKGLAKRHNLAVRLALWIEVRAAFAAAHWKRGQGVLEDLLEAKELQDRQVNCWMETKAALVRSNCRVKLDAVSAINLNVASVVNPGDAEHNNALWLNKTLEQCGFLELWMSIKCRLDGGKNFFCCLDKLRLICVTLFKLCDYLR